MYNILYLTRYFFIILDPESSVYVSEVKGSDENGDGSSIKPYKSILQVFLIYIRFINLLFLNSQIRLPLIE